MRITRTIGIGTVLCSAVAAGAGCSLDALIPLRLAPLAAGNAGKPVDIRFDQFYAERGGQKLYYDYYQPRFVDHPAPLVVLVHGGSWRMGSRKDFAEFAFDLATNGYAAASIDYRYAGSGVTYKEIVSDVLAAIRYFRENAAALNIDPQRVGLFGQSAGGHLALLTGMMTDAGAFDAERPVGEQADVRAIVNISGPTDLTQDPPESEPWTTGALENLIGRPLEGAEDELRAASPVTYARPDAPPVLTIHGDADSIVPFIQAQILTGVMNAIGARNQLVAVAGMDHLLASIWYGDFVQRYRPTVLAFLRENL